MHDFYVKNEENEQKLRNAAWTFFIPPGNKPYYFIAKRSVNLTSDLLLKIFFSESTSKKVKILLNIF